MLGLSDQDILEKLRAGETHVLKYCYQSAFPKVRGMILKNNGYDTDAEDTFQDALVIFYKNCLKPDFHLTSAISTYLYSVSWRIWMKNLRDTKPTMSMEETDFVAVDSWDFELESERDEQMEGIMEAMESAGKRCKEILILFYFNKLGLEQIASKVGMKDERAVREQKYRCMKRIKELVNG